MSLVQCVCRLQRYVSSAVCLLSTDICAECGMFVDYRDMCLVQCVCRVQRYVSSAVCL